MTTRKKSGKSKSKSMRNGRTKRGGFLELFNDSFSWFSSENKPDEVKPTSENKPFDWTFGLKYKLNPPPVPQGPTIIPGRPQQPQDVPDATVTQNSTTSSQADQAAASQPASQAAVASQAVPVTTVKGGSRLRVRTKKRSCSCRCKRK